MINIADVYEDPCERRLPLTGEPIAIDDRIIEQIVCGSFACLAVAPDAAVGGGRGVLSKAASVALALLLSTASLFALADDSSPARGVASHDEHFAHGDHEQTPIAGRQGERWPSDESLRRGMTQIEMAFAKATELAPPSRESARELALVVEQNVAYIVAHCKLPPAADAALHGLIARMMKAANAMKEPASVEDGVAQLAGVLHDYRLTFDSSHASPQPQ